METKPIDKTDADTPGAAGEESAASGKNSLARIMRYRLPIVTAFHILATIAAYAFAFLLRFDFKVPHEYLRVFYTTLPLLLAGRMASYYYYKTFSASWRFAYLRDFIDMSKAILTGSTIFLISALMLDKLANFPRSVFILEAFFSLVIMGGTKLSFRYVNEYGDKRLYKTLRNVLIVGAGKAGVLTLNEIRSNKSLGINVAGFIDDDVYKKGTNIQGVPVLGTTEDIPVFAKKYSVDEVIIATPSSSYKNIVKITEIVNGCNVKTKVVPSLGRIIQDGTYSSQIKDVSTDALLGRRVVKFCRQSDYKLMENEIRGKAVLVTGAGGSIGSELSRQVSQFGPRVLCLYERYENGLYDVEIELRKEFPDLHIIPVIGDILDAKKLDAVIKTNRIDLIYHAAAFKHVPMMEREPLQAVYNNVVGTMTVADTALKNNVNKFVLISTDKAVNPANVMGTTKRIAELVLQNFNGKSTRFIAVRFGNVIGSNGSVIPLFKKQIAEGGPITVTHPDITRYFMSIPEAVQLVMTAGAMGHGGEIFLLDMGDPIKITEIARELIRLSGLEPDRDIDIVFTGLRPGEKLHEELYWQGENIVRTDNKKITMLKPNTAGLDETFKKIKLLQENAMKGNLEEVLGLLKEIVPESTINIKAILGAHDRLNP